MNKQRHTNTPPLHVVKEGNRLSQHKYLLAVLLIGSVLLFKNLDTIYLWQDEAETALLAQNILTYGYPRAWDGKNIISQNAERDFNQHYVWTWSPWLQLYITAGSFRLFGASTLAARFPFVLIALASLCLLYFFTVRLCGSTRIAGTAILLMATSIPFLLHARQCRWYMAAVFSTLWLLYAYLMLQKKEKRGAVHFALASLLLFFSNYLIYASVMGGIILHYPYCRWQGFSRPSLRSIVASTAAALMAIIPWIIYSRAWDKSNPFEEYKMPLASRVLLIFAKNILYMNSFIVPLLFAAAIGWILFRRHKGDDEAIRANSMLILLTIACTIAVLSAMPWMYFRYLIALVPLCCILLALVIDRIMVFSKALAWGVMVLLIFTNVFSLTLPPRALRFDFLNYLYEITHDYDGPNEGIVTYLRTHGNRDQFVITNYGQLPIIFYTGMRAIGFGQSLRTSGKADWIIIRKGRGDQEYLRSLSAQYQAITIDYPDIPWENRPDPSHHHYRTVVKAPRVVIHKK
jgi:4-amino-4-deoxy-L-arabinose transferase-like glycosyltransferase